MPVRLLVTGDIDEVSQLAVELDGDARRLLAELRGGRVRRFRTAQADVLEQYLTESDLLDDEPTLDHVAIRERVKPLIFDDCSNGLLSPGRVDQLVALILQDTV